MIWEKSVDLVDIGRLPEVEADVVYAVGDIHGRLDLLEAIEAMIAVDVAANHPARAAICYLGDYIDRGPASAQVIERLSAPAMDGIERVFLKGNHEDRMLEFFEAPAEKGPRWIAYGGREALESYGVSPPDAERADWQAVAAQLRAKVPAHHLAFLRGLRLAIRWRDFLFVHAGLNPDRPPAAQSAYDLMWIREAFVNSQKDWGVRVVHGHVIVDEPAFRPNRIGIDTGAYRSGILTCLVVEETGVRLLQTPPCPRPATS